VTLRGELDLQSTPTLRMQRPVTDPIAQSARQRSYQPSVLSRSQALHPVNGDDVSHAATNRRYGGAMRLEYAAIASLVVLVMVADPSDAAERATNPNDGDIVLGEVGGLRYAADHATIDATGTTNAVAGCGSAGWQIIGGGIDARRRPGESLIRLTAPLGFGSLAIHRKRPNRDPHRRLFDMRPRRRSGPPQVP
jgi:hypothetical protein